MPFLSRGRPSTTVKESQFDLSLFVDTPLRPDAPFRSGDSLPGHVKLRRKDGSDLGDVLSGSKLEVRGYVESRTTGRGPREKMRDEDKHRHPLQESYLGIFDTASLTPSDLSSGISFSLALPRDSVEMELISLVGPPYADGPNETVPAPPSARDNANGYVEWGVEVVVHLEGGEVLVEREAFAFLPSPEVAKKVVEVEGFEEKEVLGTKGERTEIEKDLKLHSHLLKLPWGTLSSLVSVPQPHVYPRSHPSIHFSLSLSLKAPKILLSRDGKEVKIYSIICTLLRRTRTSTEEEGGRIYEDIEEMRTQTTALTINLIPDDPPRKFDLVFDLQAPAGAGHNVETSQLTPSFRLPNLSRDYLVSFAINPAHNSKTEIARIPIVLTTSEEERLPPVVQAMSGGMPKFGELKIGES